MLFTAICYYFFYIYINYYISEQNLFYWRIFFFFNADKIYFIAQ